MSAIQVERDLTLTYRQAQLALRARLLRDLALLWPIWQVNNQTAFRVFTVSAVDLIRSYRQLSADLAGAFYTAFRNAEQVAGSAAPQLVTAIAVEQIVASLLATGETMTRPLPDGVALEQLRQNAFVRVSGAVSRLTLNAGRETILQSVEADRRARGWARITDGNPCYFCLTLASRGAVYKTEQTAGFQAHDHCGCVAMPVFDGTVIPQLDRWRQMYDDAQRAGIESGLLQHGENSSDARLNAVRRFLAAAH